MAGTARSSDHGAVPSPPPSGAQLEIGYQDQRATVVEIGGGIRAYAVGGVDVLQPYDRDAMCDGAHGAVLVPWPNRLGDGRYRFDGADHQLDLTEPAKHNAIHGLLRWVPWRAVRHVEDQVVMAAALPPQPGYPWPLEVQVDYRLGPQGLVVRATTRNLGTTTCPYGIGHHPYLSPGEGLVDDCLLQFAARTRIATDAGRQLPTGTAPVAGTPYDFATPRRIGDLAIDYAFTDLERDEQGRSWVRLTRPDGRVVAWWLGASYPYLELYTADTLIPERRRRGLGVEPMSCPPDAFRSGTDVLRLEPGATVTHAWGVQLD